MRLISNTEPSAAVLAQQNEATRCGAAVWGSSRDSSHWGTPALRLAQLALVLGLAALVGACATAPEPKPGDLAWTAALPPPQLVAPDAAGQDAPGARRGPAQRAELPSNLAPITAVNASGQPVAALSPPADLWERIRRGFAMPDLQSDQVKDREQYYATRPDYIGRMTERSRKYLFHIVEELERRNMPSELALLPFIESAFNPQAISSAKAAGMWQFMPATGKHFELKQNAFRDDRRDVLASTRAALDYLQKLHGMFGDWHLALAAYNWGEGSVGRAIAKNKAAGLGTGYLDLKMPAETRQYVPKLQAVKNIVASPEAFAARLPLIENHPFFQTVAITRDIDVAVAAKLAEVSVEDFQALNPSANRPVLLAAGTPQILLPWDQAAVFQRNYEGFTGGKLASWTVWIATSNLKTAEAARKTGMDEAELRRVNHIPPSSIIKAGSTLLVPRGAKIEQDVAEHVAENGQIGLAPEALTRRTTVKARKGDTVASLAKRYRLTPGNVAEWNKFSASASLASGQQVVLFLPRTGKVLAKGQARSGVKMAKRGKPLKTTRLAKR